MTNVSSKHFTLTDRKQARSYKSSRAFNDLRVGNKIYEVDERYWCQSCDGTGCGRCNDTGIAEKKNRPNRRNGKEAR